MSRQHQDPHQPERTDMQSEQATPAMPQVSDVPSCSPSPLHTPTLSAPANLSHEGSESLLTQPLSPTVLTAPLFLMATDDHGAGTSLSSLPVGAASLTKKPDELCYAGGPLSRDTSVAPPSAASPTDSTATTRCPEEPSGTFVHDSPVTPWGPPVTSRSPRQMWLKRAKEEHDKTSSSPVNAVQSESDAAGHALVTEDTLPPSLAGGAGPDTAAAGAQTGEEPICHSLAPSSAAPRDGQSAAVSTTSVSHNYAALPNVDSTELRRLSAAGFDWQGSAASSTPSIGFPMAGASDVLEPTDTSVGASYADVSGHAPFHHHSGFARSPADYASVTTTVNSVSLGTSSPLLHRVNLGGGGSSSGAGWDSSSRVSPVAQFAAQHSPDLWHLHGQFSAHEQSDALGDCGDQAAVEMGTPLAMSMEGSPDGVALPFFSAGAARSNLPISRMRRHLRQPSSANERSLSQRGTSSLDTSLSASQKQQQQWHQGTPVAGTLLHPMRSGGASRNDKDGLRIALPTVMVPECGGKDDSLITPKRRGNESPGSISAPDSSLFFPGGRSGMFLTPRRTATGSPMTARLQSAGPSVFFLRYEQDPNDGTMDEHARERQPFKSGGVTSRSGGQGKRPSGRYAYRQDSQLFNPQQSVIHAEEEEAEAGGDGGDGSLGKGAQQQRRQNRSATTTAHRRTPNSRGLFLQRRIHKFREQYRRTLKRHAKEVANGTVVCVSEVACSEPKEAAKKPVYAPPGTSPLLFATPLMNSPGRMDRMFSSPPIVELPSTVCFDVSNLTVNRYDTVRFRWRDPRERIIETTSDFFQEFPGGMHSPPVVDDVDLDSILLTNMATAEGERRANDAAERYAAAQAEKNTTDAEMKASEVQQGTNDDRQGMGNPDGSPKPLATAATTSSLDSPKLFKESAYRMMYDVVFADPGDYYYVCTTDHRAMRVHIQVLDSEQTWWLAYVPRCLLALFVLVALALVSFGISYGVAKPGILKRLISVEKGNPAQKQSVEHIDSLLTRRLLPWLALGVLGLIVTVVAWTVSTRCCHRREKRPDAREPSSFRGFCLRTRRAWSWTTIIMTFLCFALSIGIWGALVTAVYDTSTAVNLLVNSVFDTVHTFQTAVTSAESIVGALPGVLSDTVDVPYKEINRTLDTIDDVLSDINGWVSLIASVVLAGIRALPFLSFLMLQLTVVATLYGILGAFFRRTGSTRLAVWLFLLSLAGVALGAGFYWCIHGALNVVTGLLTAFTYQNDTSGAEWAARIMFPSHSPIAQIYDACLPDGLLSSQNVAEVLNDTVNTIYDSLNEEERKDYKELFDIAGPLTNASAELYDNYFYWVAAQADQMQAYMAEVGDDSGLKKAAPLISSGIGVAMTLATALNCGVFRDLFVPVLPLMQAGMVNTVHALYALYLTLFGFIAITIVITIVTTFVLLNPRKNWYYFRTRRWFRLHWSYMVHQRLVERGGAQMLDAYQEEEYRRKSVRQHLNACRQAAMLLSLLLVVDAVVMAILGRYNSRHGLLIAGQILLWAQCVLYSFGYVLAHYRVLLEQLCTLASCLCLVAYVVTQCLIGITGIVFFANCVTHKRVESPEETKLYPIYLSCPPLTMASHLEYSLYSILTAIVAFAMFFLQLVLLFHPMQLRLLWTNLRALRVSHDALHISPKSRRLRWVVWAFFSAAVLALLLAVIISKRDTITLTNDVNRTDDADLTIVNVVDPTVGCNGNRAYCNKRLTDLTWLATHNSYSSQDLNYVTPNHYWSMEKQLTAGVRVFLIDTWYDRVDPNNESSPEDVYLCHSICLIGRQLMRTALEPLARFLDTYKEEVVVVDLEQYVTTEDIGRVLGELNLLRYTWQPHNTPANDSAFVWPTIAELVSTKQRLIVFGSEENYTKPEHPAWMLPRSHFRYETKWNTYQPDQFNCRINVYWCSRAPNPAFNTSYDVDGFMNCSDPVLGPYKNESYDAYIANHSSLPLLMRNKLALINAMVTIGVAIPSAAAEVNRPPVLTALAASCGLEWGRVPTILTVDYWNVATPLQQVVDINKLILSHGPEQWTSYIKVPLYKQWKT